MIRYVILWITHQMWNRRINIILCRAYDANLINSHQLHVLAAAFDPSQKHKVYGAGKDSGFQREDRRS